MTAMWASPITAPWELGAGQRRLAPCALVGVMLVFVAGSLATANANSAEATVAPAPTTAAVPSCDAVALRAAAPASMTIADIPNVGRVGGPKTVNGVVQVPENSLGPKTPSYCFVTGTVVTNAKTGKSANFAAELPAKAAWNGKFLFVGCGGNCGLALMRPSPSALRRGYPIFATDDGHVAPPGFAGIMDASWAVTAPGKPNTEAVTDFYYRAVHAVVEAGKQLTRNYFGATGLSHAYFDGCSDGGREGMVEVSRFPSDFDGVIAGDPYFDIGAEVINSLVAVQAQLLSAHAALNGAQLTQVDQRVMAGCDAADGVTDGLIQNPAQCALDPGKELPRCDPQGGPEGCFTPEQIASLSVMLSAVTDPAGKVIYPGYPIGNLNDAGPKVDNLNFWVGFRGPASQLQGPQPWAANPAGTPIAWAFADPTLRYLIYAGAPNFDSLVTPGISFRTSRTGPITDYHAVLPTATLDRIVRRSAAGNGNEPAAAAEFFRQGRKLILYHGYADGDITPYRTIQYYAALAKLHGGYAVTQQHARLFMVPGMAHCSGGPGPNVFGQTGVPRDVEGPDSDVLAALERWVEKGTAPAALIATKYDDDDPAHEVLRTMPLCPFPAMAEYAGTGDVNEAKNWTCAATDRRLLAVGRAGKQAGLP